MANTTKKVTNRKQFECLVDYMNQHPGIAKGRKFAENINDVDYNQLFNELALKLNRYGPPFRSSEKWEKVWQDFKNKVRKKLIKNRNERNKTGSDEYKINTMTALEEVVVKLLSLDVLIRNTNQYISEKTSEVTNNVVEELEIIPQNATGTSYLFEPVDSPTPSSHVTSSSSHITERATLHQRRAKKMKLMREHTKLLKQNVALLKDNNRYIKKMYSLKEKKFEFYKKIVNEERERSIKQQQIQLDILEYKKIKLMLNQANLGDEVLH